MLRPQVGKTSPWGRIDHMEYVADDIYFIMTGRHGGFWVSPKRLATMPSQYLVPNDFYEKGSSWFEEDCECMRVFLSFPELFPNQQDRAMAFWTYRESQPERRQA